jgi:hypothetical protein
MFLHQRQESADVICGHRQHSTRPSSTPPPAARYVARHGVRSHAVPVVLVGECS